MSGLSATIDGNDRMQQSNLEGVKNNLEKLERKV